MSTPDVLEPLVRRLESRATLSAVDRAAMLALPFQLRIFDPSAYLVRDGEPARTCGVLFSGYAFRQKLTSQGTRQIVSLNVPGEALDFQNLFLDVSDHNVQTLTRAEIAIIPRDAIRAIAQERPAIRQAILIYTLVEASIFREWVLNVGRRNARARLAHLLCEFAIRVDVQTPNQTGGYALPMTQEQLGDALGLTAVHVNRTLKSLEADGLIARNKRDIAFPSWDELRDVADFSARYLHLQRRD